MTVAELITKLQAMPQELPVVVLGYEGGYDNAEVLKIELVFDTNWKDNKKNCWFYGRHDDREFLGADKGEPAVLISRENYRND